MLTKRYIKCLDMELSPLGFGLFRLPVGNRGEFSVEVFELIDAAMESGVNYYDTAWNYLNGYSENLIRSALVQRYQRDMFIIADKLPSWLCFSTDDFEKYLRIQLERLGVNTIDFYLLHALNSGHWDRLRRLGVLDFLDRMKRDGIIKKAGFSFHDNAKNLNAIVKGYDWDFAQLQINYFDWNMSDISQGYKLLEDVGVACMTMETVRGGLLARLPEEADEILRKVHPEWSQATWAFRFVSSLDNVAVMLSGMNTKEQLEDNVSRIEDLYRSRVDLTEEENKAFKDVVDIICGRDTNLCTGCGYCRDACPNGIRISDLFRIYNEYKLDGDDDRFRKEYLNIPYNERANNCAFCKRCEKRCPQYISITDWLMLVDQEYQKVRLKDLKSMIRPECGLIVWGAGKLGKLCIKIMDQIDRPVYLVCDNNQSLWGNKFEGITVISPDKLIEESKKQNLQIIISVQSYFDMIRKQISDIGLADSILDWKMWEE